MTKTQAEMILCLKGEYSPTDVKQRYRKLSKVSHPDQNGDEDLFALIKEAYEVLKDQSGNAKEVPLTKSNKKKKEERTPVSERAKIIAACERIDFTKYEFCMLASGYTVKKTFLYNGKEKVIEFTFQDFMMNYYKNIFLVFDLDIEFDEIGLFSKEHYTTPTRKLSILTSDNMIAEYRPEIKAAKNRKIEIKYTVFEQSTNAVIDRTDNSKMTILEYSLNSDEFGLIKIKLIVNTRVKRE
ncbi:MAG: J domain-containing protein [Clostridia bacterium]|nr:J domain-containing protein [Clostridia bacterium]